LKSLEAMKKSIEKRKVSGRGGANLEQSCFACLRVFIVIITSMALSKPIAADVDYSLYKEKWREYVTWAQGVILDRVVALAVAPNGSWCASFGVSENQAKQKAIHCCEHRYEGKTCIVKDVNLESAFIREPVNTSKYCARQSGVSFIDPSACRVDGGLVYENYQSAKIKSDELNKAKNEQETTKPSTEPIEEISELKNKLLELKELVDEGLISQDDYEKAKNQLLEKISH